jgi:hypothetical protein
MRTIFLGLCLAMAATSVASAQDCANGRCNLPAKVVATVAQPVASVVNAVVESRPIRTATAPVRAIRRSRLWCRK